MTTKERESPDLARLEARLLQSIGDAELYNEPHDKFVKLLDVDAIAIILELRTARAMREALDKLYAFTAEHKVGCEIVPCTCGLNEIEDTVAGLLEDTTHHEGERG